MSILRALVDVLSFQYVLFSVLVATLVIYIWKCLRDTSSRLPPGPRGVPVFGYLPYLTENLHLDFTELHKVYGRIFSLKMGVRRAVVINDFACIKEIFNKHEYSDKPPDLYRTSPTVEHQVHQEDWKDWRRFSLSALRTMGMGKNKLHAAMEEEVRTVLERLDQCQGDVDLHKVLYPAVNSIIISLICGKRLKEDLDLSKTIVEFSRFSFVYLNISSRLMFLPFLRPFAAFLFPKLKEFKVTMDLMEKYLWDEITNHIQEQSDAAPEDYIEHYLKEVEKSKGQKTSFNTKNLNKKSRVLFLAGTDSSLRTMEWVLLHLAQRQDIQERAYQEILTVFGKERLPSIKDIDQLPYLDAVLAESSRFHTLVPLPVPHWTTRDTKLGNYVIPKDTMVYSNTYAVHMDPEFWDRPEQFNPNRFLTTEGKRIKDPECLMPFGIGKRRCIGETLAREEVFVFVSAILQHFKILPPSGGLSLESLTVFLNFPKYPLVRAQKRD